MLVADSTTTVPNLFCWNADTDPSFPTRNAGGVDDSTKGVSGVFLMGPLSAAATSDFCSDSRTGILRGRLRFARENIGSRQARILLALSDPNVSSQNGERRG